MLHADVGQDLEEVGVVEVLLEEDVQVALKPLPLGLAGSHFIRDLHSPHPKETNHTRGTRAPSRNWPF